ncbi:MAG: protein kinase [Planctomycetes bacterium]|nr:protein kinase [Planctomycetota bacterium]
MNEAEWKRLKAAVSRALDLPEEERARALDAALGPTGALREEAARILAALQAPGGPLGTLAPESSAPAGAGWRPPDRLADLALLRELGRGSMGVVLLAWQESLAREVAVKILPPADAADPAVVERFAAEARKAARIQHPAIVTVHAVGFDSGLHYFVMERVEGHDLGREIELQIAGTRERLLPAFHSRDYLPAVARLCRTVALALAHAHAHALVHRDVKPSNVLLDTQGQPRVVDFGIARDAREGELVSRSRLEGTPYYMSPEQVRIRGQHVDHRTDVYSLGIVLYELLTLRRPFDGRTTGEVLRKILDVEPRLVRRDNPRVPRDLEAVCLKAIAKSPDERYATAAELAQDLERFLGHEAVQARPVSALRRGARTALRRWRLGAALGSAATAAILGGLLVERQVEAAAAGRARDVVAVGVEAARTIARDPRASDESTWDRVEALRQELAHAGGAGLESLAPELAAAARAELERLSTVLTAEADLALERARANASPDRERDVADALRLLERSRRIGSRDATSTRGETSEALLPRLSVRVRPPGTAATVHLRPFDLVRGEPGPRVLLGELPIESRPVPPGWHRIVVDCGDGRFAECTREFEAVGRDVVVEIQLPPPLAEAARGMLRVKGGRLPASGAADRSCQLAEVELEVADFLLDAREVANGPYRAFLDATGRPAPLLWREDPALLAAPDFDRLPVVDVSIEDAIAYCEWRGARLPTHAEWELVARRELGSPAALPAAELVRGSSANVHGAAFALDASHAERAARYLRSVRAVADGDPVGFAHLLGNVWELTESPVCVAGEPRGAHGTAARLALGGAWDAGTQHGSLHAVVHSGTKGAFLMRGFRCAKSVDP